MGKIQLSEANWREDPSFRALCSALANCANTGEVASFLRDIGTLGELEAWCERLEVAKQLNQGKTYREVASNTGASTTTVTRVAKFLLKGEGGYKKYLEGKREQISESQEPKKSSSVLQGYLDRAR